MAARESEQLQHDYLVVYVMVVQDHKPQNVAISVSVKDE
jgi:hypothetical protein